MILWAIVENGQWKAGIGDPTFGGWLTVLAYLITSLICFIGGWQTKHFSQKIKRYRWFWWSLATLLLVLGINKQLDLQSWLTLIGKSLAIAQGWYERRRIIQGCFIAAIAITFLSLLMFIFQAMEQDWKTFRLSLFGLFFLLGFILIRALSFHHIDQLINWELSGFKMNWLLELTGITCIGISAINYIHKLQKLRNYKNIKRTKL